MMTADSGVRSIERRRSGASRLSPAATLRGLPALVVLQRIPVPVLAIADDGGITFANAAFSAMTGYSSDELAALRFAQIFADAAGTAAPLDGMRAYANLVVSLAHRDGSIVRASMSKSALRRDEDRVALAAFQDLTEKLWMAGR